jgi:RNA polymerase sigma factor (sigma-70 family)
MAEQGYRVPEVCRIIGISYRQLDYWARTELVRPSIQDAQGSGTQRLYSFQDLVELRVIKKLLDAGVSLQRVRKAVDRLNENQRHVIELAYFEGLSQSEMAERMGQPLGTVKTWVRSALKNLREELGEKAVTA